MGSPRPRASNPRSATRASPGLTMAKKRACEREIDCSPQLQAIRAVDVVLLGPAMIVIGSKQPGPLGMFVSAAGVATIAFNADRFFRARRRRRRAIRGRVAR